MLLAYFNATYINGGARRVQRPAAASDDDDDGGASVPRITLRPLPPLFPIFQSDHSLIHAMVTLFYRTLESI